MSTRKQDPAAQHLFSQIWQLKANGKQQMQWLLRGLLVIGKQRHVSKAGFVLPTTVMLLMVLTLVVAALIFRTSSRTAQVAREYQEKVIYNAASPAVDRAKAKLEYLFNGDTALPNGVPGQGQLIDLMRKDDKYTLKDQNPLRNEKRLDLNRDGQGDNAWSFRADTDGDGQDDATIAYSIIGQIPANQNDLSNQSNTAISNRARNLLVRNGSVDSTQTNNAACLARQQNQQNNLQPEEGWFVSNANQAVLRKNFQINAFVIPDDSKSRSVATLELQQDRQLARGNKWGAWFRYDLEIFNLPQFNWNGAMHTEGSFFVGDAENDFAAYLISSPNSCVYSRTASEITLRQTTNAANQVQFQGQIVNGSLSTNQFMNNSIPFHFLDPNNQPIYTGSSINISSNTDSVSNNFTGTPSDIALDPVALFTQDISQANNVTNWSTVRDNNWQNSKLFTNRRVYNQQQIKPYVDDTYRADNRYGPKPTYGRDSALAIPAGLRIGAPISNSQTRLVSNDPIGNNIENLGLDGYWERRARREGLRVIVGQRLELGNPLPPPTPPIPHEARQRRALRDNLAAVQATAIYHQANRGAAGEVLNLPVACLATTAHPGTAETIRRSRTFNTFGAGFGGLDNAGYPVVTDFFTGWGTNGYEFTVHPESNYTAASTLMRALRNLAHFAGDYEDTNNDGSPERSGAFPPTQEATGSTTVHPYPEMIKSGNFSELRRVISLIDSGTSYENLSPADQSTLNTAACMMGMLAYNIRYINNYDYNPPNPNLTELGTKIGLLMDGNTSNSGNVNVPATSQPQAFIAGLERWRETVPGAQKPDFDKLIQLARLIQVSEQWKRDRTNGFANGFSPMCNPSPPPGGPAFPSPKDAELKKLCSNQPGYTILYYLFPEQNHDENDTPNPTRPDPNRKNKPYILNSNTGYTYQAFTDLEITNIALKPRILPGDPRGLAGEQWQLPSEPANPFSLGTNTISLLGTGYRVPFIDSGVFNGREMMSVRVLNFDLDLLRRNTLPIDPANPDDNWLPQRGVVYAFREDAVREDGIARPAATTWANCDTAAEITTISCRMNANTPQDPPINSTNGIATKPVDFLPDPDRRAYGFRLRNGADLTRTTLALNHANNLRGLSFISDNPVYVQGNFNLHSTNGTTNNLEEFTQTLNRDGSGNFTNFYDRSTQENRFANASEDRWRPTEIIADAITILSNNFCDGSIEDSFLTAGPLNGAGAITTVPIGQYNCGIGNGVTSYLNQNRPSISVPTTDWSRENSSDPLSPIRVNENGNPVRISSGPGPYTGGYHAFSENITSSGKKPLITAAETRVNSILVSGLVPSRTLQHNGGLYNFPRFIENWTNIPLNIAGALLQLNFSTYATAPWDHQAWEPNGTPALSTSDIFRYYSPPNRLWGYDVALQMAPAGPVSRRFVTVNNTRSEFYRELPVDDPYIQNLRCSLPEGGHAPLDPRANCR